MFSIEQLKQNLKIVRPNLFYVDIIPPSFLSKYGFGPYGETAKFSYRCEAAELPGRTLATVDDTSFGPTVKFGYDMTYNDITLQIIASEDMVERKLFEEWMDGIVTPTSQNFSELKGGLIKYYDDYSGALFSIRQLNDAGKVLARYKLHRAFPIQLSPMNLSWGETDTYQRFAVTISYRYHTVEFS